MFESIIQWMDWCTIIFTFMTMCGVGYGLFQRRKEKNEISIILQTQDKEKELPLKILRRNFTRAEILGYLGICNNSKENYNIAYLKDSQFLADILKVQKGKADLIKIKIANTDEHALL